ncbi:AAA family ATPase [Luteimonas fraxinea]|uniref:AAA family ATPase n=1 Tax=Luteimonas fraxinea TaxID=2901869 RepID=UPI001E41A5AB|nr:AAA family ATPase [Luteimonas fraxinea]UHH09846.1 AAA family ATPase [Luteimonas fraxinea]
MTVFRVHIENVQHISNLTVELDLSKNGIICVAGKNGAGKTTLIKALKNIASADTFMRTSAPTIFNEESRISYNWNNEQFDFVYDPSLRTLDCRMQIPDSLRGLVVAELPVPHGERFNYFRSISDADLSIRRAIVLGEYTVPNELISFLEAIYGTGKFERVVQVTLGRNQYFCTLLGGGRYIREDYFSSGEYFLISLYKRLRSECRLIAIDEIDISLDPAAQVRLVGELRRMCSRYSRNVLFTTHSLAMLKTVLPGELRYMEQQGDEVVLIPLSYSFIKTILFGFRGWDRYILTEDDVLQRFIEYVISRFCGPSFFSCKVIYIGGSQNVIDLMRRNAVEGFLSDAAAVISVLDGDQRDTRAGRSRNTLCIPVDSVEKALHRYYQDSAFEPRLDASFDHARPKVLFSEMMRQRVLSEREIFDVICCNEAEAIAGFAATLSVFLASEPQLVTSVDM